MKRFDLEVFGSDHWMVEAKDGEWVRHDDVVKAIDELIAREAKSGNAAELRLLQDTIADLRQRLAATVDRAEFVRGWDEAMKVCRESGALR